jgi:hypothetical protein
MFAQTFYVHLRQAIVPILSINGLTPNLQVEHHFTYSLSFFLYL